MVAAASLTSQSQPAPDTRVHNCWQNLSKCHKAAIVACAAGAITSLGLLIAATATSSSALWTATAVVSGLTVVDALVLSVSAGWLCGDWNIEK